MSRHDSSIIAALQWSGRLRLEEVEQSYSDNIFMGFIYGIAKVGTTKRKVVGDIGYHGCGLGGTPNRPRRAFSFSAVRGFVCTLCQVLCVPLLKSASKSQDGQGKFVLFLIASCY